MGNFVTFLNDSLLYFRSMRLADALDILIVAVMIYAAIGFIRRTNSIKVALGILILILVMWASSSLNLAVTSFIVRQVLSIGILAVVVLFQPEIRRALERVDNSRLFRFFSSAWGGQPIESVINEVVDACEEMSASRTGALIVFERNNHISEVTSGTQVDAIVSSRLLRNIFFNKSPLHDGAVVISDGRLTAAACMLPMSKNQNLSRDLGMRHRAGIGMSEQLDAVVVIVSEETGAISVAIGGLLKRHLTPDTFESLLKAELLPEEETAGSNVFTRLLKKRGNGDAGEE